MIINYLKNYGENTKKYVLYFVGITFIVLWLISGGVYIGITKNFLEKKSYDSNKEIKIYILPTVKEIGGEFLFEFFFSGGPYDLEIRIYEFNKIIYKKLIISNIKILSSDSTKKNELIIKNYKEIYSKKYKYSTLVDDKPIFKYGYKIDETLIHSLQLDNFLDNSLYVIINAKIFDEKGKSTKIKLKREFEYQKKVKIMTFWQHISKL